jgi:DNA-binding NtrC family response regulator
MILAPEGDIDATCLPEEIREPVVESSEALPTSEVPTNGHHFVSLRELEDKYIEQVLTATGHNKTQTARILGIHPTSLLRRLKKDKPTGSDRT